jgi:hypothetical protein
MKPTFFFRPAGGNTEDRRRLYEWLISLLGMASRCSCSSITIPMK